MSNINKTEITRSLKSSKKYRYVCDETIDRMGDWAAARYSNHKTAVKSAKNKLHQIYGAYFDRINIQRIETIVNDPETYHSENQRKESCLEILSQHSSTKERVSFMEEVYPVLFQKTGYPQRIMDIACGLHPFAVPWMNTPQRTYYYAVDIDIRLIAMINTFFTRYDQEGVAECRDVLVRAPEQKADLVLILKTLPCLEQQEKKVSAELLKKLRSPYIVVSFPTRTLGGKNIGMKNTYSLFMKNLIETLRVPAEIIEFRNELFFILKMREDIW